MDAIFEVKNSSQVRSTLSLTGTLFSKSGFGIGSLACDKRFVDAREYISSRDEAEIRLK